MKPSVSHSITCLPILLAILCAGRAQAVVLTIDQVATYAFNAGFRGGALVSAIAAAEAESGFDTEAVNNNVHITTAAGVLLPGPNGRPVLASIPRTGKQMLPQDSIQPVGDGRYGRVVSHCRGLWQFNDVVHTRWPTNAQAFDPASAAACAWPVSRHGRDWGKWVVMQNATAWQSARLARARTAAIAKDFSVLRSTPGERAQGRVTGGAIRSIPAGTRIRALHAGDMGRVLAGPVQAAITQGRQTSTKLWWQIEWDSGHTGWASEDLLIRSSTLGLQPAQPAYAGWPHEINSVNLNAALTWCTGANTANQRLYFGTTAALNGPSDLKLNGLFNVWPPPGGLAPFTRYYWRVDTVSAQGTVLTGPVWNFLTRPPAPAPVVLETVATAPVIPQPGFTFTITCSTHSPAGQPVLVGAGLHRTGTPPIEDIPNNVPRFAPPGAGSFTRNFNLPLNTPQGNYTLLVRLVQDYNGNGIIDNQDFVITEQRVPLLVAPPGPLVEGLAISPASMAPGQSATITATVTSLPGSTLGLLKVFRSEGASAPGLWTWVDSRNMNSNTRYDVSIQNQPPSIRRYWYALQATDNLNRTAPDGPYFRPVSVLVTIGDRTPPVLTWTSPADGAVISPSTPLSGNITDNDIIESASYRMDDDTWQPLSPGFWNVFPAAGAGPHSISVRATDRSGNTTIQTRFYYIAGQSSGSDFDEDQDFTSPSGHQPFWRTGFQGLAGIMNGRIESPDDSSPATFSNFKRPLPWARSVEVSFQCGPEGAGFTWDRNFFDDLLLRVVRSAPNQWQLHAGQVNTYQTIPLTLTGMTPDARLSVLGRFAEGTFYCRVVTVDAAAAVVAESSQSLTNLGIFDLGDALFQVTGTATGAAWLDDVSFRALRPENFLRCRGVTALPPTATQRSFTVDWFSVPGRLYHLELMDPVTRQWARTDGPVSGTGLITSRTLTFPKTRPSALLRVRQLRP